MSLRNPPAGPTHALPPSLAFCIWSAAQFIFESSHEVKVSTYFTNQLLSGDHPHQICTFPVFSIHSGLYTGKVVCGRIYKTQVRKRRCLKENNEFNPLSGTQLGFSHMLTSMTFTRIK